MADKSNAHLERALFDDVVTDATWTKLGYSISARLRAIRELRGMTQRRLATVAGVSRTVVSNLERNVHTGERPSDPTISTVYRLAFALGVPPSMLLPGSDVDLGQVSWEQFDQVPLADLINSVGPD